MVLRGLLLRFFEIRFASLQGSQGISGRLACSDVYMGLRGLGMGDGALGIAQIQAMQTGLDLNQRQVQLIAIRLNQRRHQ